MNSPGQEAVEPGPRVGASDTGEALLPDSQLGAPWWFPAPELLAPDPATFGYTYRVTGFAADGSPVIAARVTATLRFPPPPAGARRVEPSGLAVRLRIPFVDAGTGEPTAAELPGSVAADADGTLHCTIDVSGALARATYGALSVPGFQPGSDPGLIIDSTFVGVQETAALWGGGSGGGGSAGEPAGDGVLLPPELDLSVVVPVGWPFEPPIRTVTPPPDDHPEWGTMRTEVTGLVTSETVAQKMLQQNVFEQAGPGVIDTVTIDTAAVDTATVDTAAVDSATIDATAIDRVAIDTAVFALPRAFAVPMAFAGDAMLVSDDQTTELPSWFGSGVDADGYSPQPTTPPAMDLAVTVARQYRLPLVVPCRDHPACYQRDPGNGQPLEVIGCQDAFGLGRLPARRFAPAPQLDSPSRYAVWESLQQPATYLVVPEHYRVGRGPGGRPELQWLQVFDATIDAGLPCLLQARCVPDLAPHELADLENRLRADAEGREVRVLLPTSPTVGATGATVGSSTLDGALRAVLDDDSVRVALRVDHEDAVVVAAQLRGGESLAQLTFATGDAQLPLSATVHLDLDDLAGPYPSGPVRRTTTGWWNGADTEATVNAVWARTANGWTRSVLQPALTIGAQSGAVSTPAPDQLVLAETTVAQADPAQLTVRNVYLENLHTVVLVRRDVDLAGAGVAEVRLAFAVSGVAVSSAVLPAGAPLLEVTLVQPLTGEPGAFDRKVQITATITRTDGTSRASSSGTVTVDLSASSFVALSALIGPL